MSKAIWELIHSVVCLLVTIAAGLSGIAGEYAQGAFFTSMLTALYVQRISSMKNKSALEEALACQIRAFQLPPPEREYQFHPVRKWRFDFAWPEQLVACEVDGAIWTGAANTRGGSGILRDCEKRNEAVTLGWRILRVCKPHIVNLEAVGWIKRALE